MNETAGTSARADHFGRADEDSWSGVRLLKAKDIGSPGWRYYDNSGAASEAESPRFESRVGTEL